MAEPTNLGFEPTRQAQRVLERLLRLKENFPTQDNITIPVYEGSEAPTVLTDANMLCLFDVLVQRGAAAKAEPSNYLFLQKPEFNETIAVGAEYKVEGMQLEQLQSLMREMQRVLEPEQFLVTATLSFVGIGTPQVTLGSNVYVFRSMSSGGAPFRIVEYCLAHPRQLVPLTELKANNAVPTQVTNINQALKGSCFDSSTGPLRHFINAAPRSITVTPTIGLSEDDASIIASSATTKDTEPF